MRRIAAKDFPHLLTDDQSEFQLVMSFKISWKRAQTVFVRPSLVMNHGTMDTTPKQSRQQDSRKKKHAN